MGKILTSHGLTEKRLIIYFGSSLYCIYFASSVEKIVEIIPSYTHASTLVLGIATIPSLFLTIYSLSFISSIGVCFCEMRSNKCIDFIESFLVYERALIARVIIRIRVNGPGPVIHQISPILYSSTMLVSIAGNSVAISRSFLIDLTRVLFSQKTYISM